jgi:hypothetical protein
LHGRYLPRIVKSVFVEKIARGYGRSKVSLAVQEDFSEALKERVPGILAGLELLIPRKVFFYPGV